MRDLDMGDVLRHSAGLAPAPAAPVAGTPVVVVVVVAAPDDGPTQGQVLQAVYRRAVAEQELLERRGAA